MKYKIQYSKLAIEDLERAWSEVFDVSQNDTITREYILGLMDAVDKKGSFPKSGTPLYYEDSFTGYYYVSFKLYFAFYRIEGSTILVDRVLYAKSDYMRKLNLK